MCLCFFLTLSQRRLSLTYSILIDRQSCVNDQEVVQSWLEWKEKLTWSFGILAISAILSPFWGRTIHLFWYIFFSFFGRSIDQILFFCDNNPFTFCWVVKRNKLGAIWHSHNVTFASFCEPVHEVITPPQNTLLWPSGDLGISLVWRNLSGPQLIGPTVEILFKLN